MSAVTWGWSLNLTGETTHMSDRLIEMDLLLVDDETLRVQGLRDLMVRHGAEQTPRLASLMEDGDRHTPELLRERLRLEMFLFFLASLGGLLVLGLLEGPPVASTPRPPGRTKLRA
jgi:hypothetical protein